MQLTRHLHHPFGGAAARSGFLRRGGGLPPVSLLIPAGLVALAMVLPLAYLVIRSAGASSEAWELLFRLRTAQILGRSALLVAVVTGTSVALAVPLAWLTARTDLPFRRLWAVLTAMPLVVPSYVGAFLAVSALGPKGLLQQLLAPIGVDRLPEIYGLPGAAITLTLLSYPYILLTVRAGLRNMDPSLDEAARTLGHGPWSAVLRLTLPQLRPSIAAGSLLVALYTLSRLRRRLHHAVRDLYVGDISAVSVVLRPEHRRVAVAGPGAAGRGDPDIGRLSRGPEAGTPARAPVRRDRPQAGESWEMAMARGGPLFSGDHRGPGASDGGAGVLAR